ncbi:SDR family oxidoreductase [Chryseobacterium joostei]|uniref:NADP-dependent 3-hydroxy acid dehydrogenase YdfG n=2 Tax=Chryseobacterium TaxID=59732 RepID=A0A1N7HS17_9FLAO|nr:MULTISPECIES: SDR family oxidoreductase [Chryseobacterium]AZA99311.1 SDR family oxidoreductase [Chryseobacterium joostei]SIS27642.1 NADP-dependent 3-hydroxy acid dehydrogenase YdfG [Chryseobacterium joostei]SIS71485.1 NADP-dependent 3-hydroxy acid dehydrogenase YdfG [Chryseobacterium ureilyticum]
MKKLKESVTIITGASSGIGAATALKLAKAGTSIVLVSRADDKIGKVKQQIQDGGGKAEIFVADVTDIEQMKTMVDFAIEKFGRIDNLVNNAGLMLFSQWKDVAIDEWNAMIDTNIKGYLNAIAAVLPKMLEQKSGHIVNMGSVAGINIDVGAGIYHGTKFFVRAITESLRKEVSVHKGIKISLISPGVINTGWADKVTNKEGAEIAAELNKQAIEPEDIANAVLFAFDQPDNVNVNDIVISPTLQDW